VLLAAAAGFAGVIAAYLSPEIVFGWLVKASGALIVFIYMSICLSQVRLRHARERAHAPPPLLPMWFFPWLSYLAIAAMIAMLVAMSTVPDLRSQLWASLISVAVALIAYAIKRARTAGDVAPGTVATDSRSP
jgi:L-asparagine transporter-like permease